MVESYSEIASANSCLFNFTQGSKCASLDQFRDIWSRGQVCQ